MANKQLSAILVGAGKWANEYWVPFLNNQQTIRVMAVADPNIPAAEALAERLNVGAVFGTFEKAMSPQADLVIILSSPESHAELIVIAHQLGLDVITEKPAATDPKGLASLRILPDEFRAVVTQNYRYEANIQTLRGILTSGRLGQIRSVHTRFAADYRIPGSWDVGDAHTMPHPMLLEGSIHHFDMMRYLTGSNISRVVTSSRNPPDSSFQGDTLVHCLLEFSNGALGTYEATLLCAGQEQRWHHEYYRVECEHGAIECDGWRVRILQGRQVEPVEVTGDPSKRGGHQEILRQYLLWRQGGPVAETALSDNLNSLAGVMAAVRSTEVGNWSDVSIN